MLNSITKLKSIDSSSSVISLRSDGIIEVLLKHDIEVTLEMLKEQVSVFENIGGGKKYPIIFIAGKFTLIASDARKYSASQEANKYTLASAYVLNSIAQKLLGNVYLKIDRPIVPSKIFNSEDAAINWLHQFTTEV